MFGLFCSIILGVCCLATLARADAEDYDMDEDDEEAITWQSPMVKRFGSDAFFEQREREKYLMQRPQKVAEYPKPKVKRSRESTLVELIQLCRNSGNNEDDENEDLMTDILFNAPVYGKRMSSSLMQQQQRTKMYLRSVRNCNRKIHLNQLFRQKYNEEHFNN